MSKNKMLVIEYRDDESSRRQSTAHFLEDPESGAWKWCVPDVLDETQAAEWNAVMSLLSDVDGQDLRHVVCGVGLMDHCLGTSDGEYDDSLVED